MICYSILTFSAIDDRNNVIPQSEMYNDIFQKKNINHVFLEKINIKGTADRFYMHTYLTLTLFMLFIIT